MCKQSTQTMSDVRTQLEEQLKAIGEVATPNDLKEAEIKLKVSKRTLDKYLQGNIVRLDTTLSLIEFFSERLSKRYQEIREVNLI